MPQYARFFDAALVRKYDQPGPRYTSYPTAVQLTPAFGVSDYREAVIASNTGRAKPLSLYVHVPFCENPCFYCGCNKVTTRDRSRSQRYLTFLMREIASQAALFEQTRSVQQLHFGGGTPTYLTDDELAELMLALRQSFNFVYSPNHEYSIEIDPRTVSPERLAVLADLGFNRVSLGVQDLDPHVQRAINRIQPAEQTFSLIEAARRLPIRGVSVDLIYGLPRQSIPSFSSTLDRVIEARPNRVAVYSYAHLPNVFKAQTKIVTAELPSAVDKLALLETTVAKLTSAGYVYIGMDHFALPDDDLVAAQQTSTLQRNFQGYSTHGDCDLIGLGVSAISNIGDCYAQNRKVVEGYQASVNADGLATERGRWLTHDDRVRRAVIQGLMCDGRVLYQPIEVEYSVDFGDYFHRELRALVPLSDDGLVAVARDGIEVTPVGRLLVRSIAMIFDAYLRPSDEARTPQYSRVV
jgi:oxygen-independent coproporphyrinogen-3 oxidase